MERLLRERRKVSGALLFVAAFATLMGIITAEARYPKGYSTATNDISDLGAPGGEHSVTHQPSAAIFNTAMVVSGAAIGLGAVFVHRTYRRWAVTLPLSLLGIGLVGVGVFPSNYSDIHAMFALLALVSGGVAAAMSYGVLAAPFRYIAAALGVVSLLSLALAGVLGPVLGDGGMERWTAYPVTLWLAGFGGYLMSARHPDATVSSD
ncbi:MAG: DUF998 domain-containing protein [Dehalococcoidia bacterium]